jgi:hypothetical protein
MLEDHQNESIRKGRTQLNVTNLRTQKLSDSYCTESSAPWIKVAVSCNIFCNSFNCLPKWMQTYSLYWIKLNNFAIAQYGVLAQLLALVQWSARAHALYITTAMILVLRLCQCVTPRVQVPGPDSWRPWPGLLTDWLLTLAITRWPTWAVLVRLRLHAHCHCGASTWSWSSSCKGNLNLNGRGQPTHWHYSHSMHYSKSMCWIKSVAIQLDTRPQFVGGGEAGGGQGRASGQSQWRPQPALARSAGDVISEKPVIS